MYIESENLDMAGNILADIFTKSHAGQELRFSGRPETYLEDFSFLIFDPEKDEIPSHTIEKLADIFNEVGIPVLRRDKPHYVSLPTFGPYLSISRNQDDPAQPETLIELKMIRLEQLWAKEEALRKAFSARFSVINP